MTLIAQLIPTPAALSDPETASVLSALALAIDDPALPVPQPHRAAIERIRQANDKIQSGKPLAQLSELVVLAQFGGASLGTVIADICRDPAMRSVCEHVFMSRFLTATVLAIPEHCHLIPAVLLRRSRIGAVDCRDPVMREVYSEILKRSLAILAKATIVPDNGSHAGLRRYLRKQKALTRRQTLRLAKYGPLSRKSVVGPMDRLAVSTALLLGRENIP